MPTYPLKNLHYIERLLLFKSGDHSDRRPNCGRSERPGYGLCSFLISLILTGFISIPAYAGDVREIDLSDGSVIQGEVISLSNGIYTIRSDNLGIIKLEESKVLAIRPRSSAMDSQSAQTGSSPGQMQSLQQKMMNDQEIMVLIQSLQNDPEFKRILEDPEIMKAVNAGDVAALAANPKFMKLLNNATVQEIEKKVK